jgi:hypothetical protein
MPRMNHEQRRVIRDMANDVLHKLTRDIDIAHNKMPEDRDTLRELDALRRDMRDLANVALAVIDALD